MGDYFLILSFDLFLYFSRSLVTIRSPGLRPSSTSTYSRLESPVLMRRFTNRLSPSITKTLYSPSPLKNDPFGTRSTLSLYPYEIYISARPPERRCLSRGLSSRTTNDTIPCLA